MDISRNERIRGTTKVGEISKRVGHVSRRRIRREESDGDGGAGEKRRGRPKRRWLDSISNYLSERGLSEEDAQDRPRWRRLTRHMHRPHIKVGKDEEEVARARKLNDEARHAKIMSRPGPQHNCHICHWPDHIVIP